MVAHKPWGVAETILRTKTFAVEKITVEAGGYCSMHYHSGKRNLFHLLSGSLLVVEIPSPRHPKIRGYTELIGPGASRWVEAGVMHQFWCRVPTVAIEIYVPEAGTVFIDHDDIHRDRDFPVGGIEPVNESMHNLWYEFERKLCTRK
jgi:mannose-6-phosphate isomerase-like protein (cupin superfamily)